ncbi:MAG: protein-glutamate O-methyltransferase CheR [Anaerolineales bacterium]
MELEVYQEIKRNVKKLLDLDLEHYKDEQMRRRLDSWLVRSGAPDWKAYFDRLRGDEKERNRFRDYLTINVSAFFRDPERWKSLAELVLSRLLKEANQRGPLENGLRIWSAGCSIGAEPYTLAILLDEIAPRRRHSILATDYDLSALNKARQGGPYTAEEIQNLNLAQRSAYLQPGGPPYYVIQSLTKKITFQEHNLFADPFPKEMDLIVCRNVVIYFTAAAKEQLYRAFHDALRPGGILFVGATEIIPHPQTYGLRNVGISFYERV